MLTTCTYPGCATRTIGLLCVRHEPPPLPLVYPRGRPYPAHEHGNELAAPAAPALEKELVPNVVLMEGGA
jgi:hypothetical protein